MPKVIIEIGTTMGDLVYIGDADNNRTKIKKPLNE